MINLNNIYYGGVRVELSSVDLVSYIGLACIWIALIMQWRDIKRDVKKRKKENKYQYRKDSWITKSYIWQVFVRRAYFRLFASSIPYIIFIIPTFFVMMFYLIIVLPSGKPLKFEELNHVKGKIVDTYHRGGRYRESRVTLQDVSGDIHIYTISNFSDKAEAKRFLIETKDKQVDIWYKNMRSLAKRYRLVLEMKIDGEYALINKRKKKYNYEGVLQNYNDTPSNILWWLQYGLVGVIWLWILNRKELPIHRVNKRKYDEKYNIKDI